jgi:hypothetical protein
MLKESSTTITKSDSGERSNNSKSVVGDIFRTMAYNENQVENFSTILVITVLHSSLAFQQ